MPSQAQAHRALAFLTEHTNQSSGCPEEHYLHSKSIAEFYCTLTNAGFFAVGYYYQDYATLAAAFFSTISHIKPLKGLIALDILAAGFVFLKLLSNYPLLINHPDILAAGLVTFTFGALDKFVGRNNLVTFGSLFHSGWHLSAAFALLLFNQALSIETNPLTCVL